MYIFSLDYVSEQDFPYLEYLIGTVSIVTTEYGIMQATLVNIISECLCALYVDW